MKRSVASMLLLVGLLLPWAGAGAQARKVRVTLVRWPYT